MKPITADVNAISRCGLYCGACKKYRSGACSGCAENDKATWCKIRSCCHEHGYASCADCQEHADATDCETFDNLMGRFFGLLFRSNRPGCIQYIKEHGYEAHAHKMAEAQRMSVPR